LGFGFVFAQLQGREAMRLRSGLAKTQNSSLLEHFGRFGKPERLFVSFQM